MKCSSMFLQLDRCRGAVFGGRDGKCHNRNLAFELYLARLDLRISAMLQVRFIYRFLYFYDAIFCD